MIWIPRYIQNLKTYNSNFEVFKSDPTALTERELESITVTLKFLNTDTVVAAVMETKV